ncbi:GTP 3',8-cyclase MoaA [Cylindrospermopsis raciborskii LB2897]|jgi:cyclic pyranopterin phosphate synthase|uniref:GTP 3',8-cyclase MoaA n=1 Tax=Cylindrospermopsis raciborskii TaxID=77022 RepID=UPI001454E0FB|nr:GTP 3',8-cyclase MoaA [Cylindrospermopsis raciborskii]MBG0743188.1 GTP 3',8-cyclase MoaA [Cylindrospermopsis raciborskii KL1]NLQ06762.1 GTP 3',8-cyclase MoaA [Cylindrospermopsis raciborskii LB2897]
MNQINYLRISLIDRCNFRCLYCMPNDTEINYILKKQLLTNDELLTLIKDVFIPVGFNRFRLTGGEPLLRPGVVDLVNKIAHLPQTQDLSMTTNGFLLAPLAQDLYNAGLTRINISLDSLNPNTFNLIIGDHSPHGWEQVWHGIQFADKVGFNPLKLNVVVIPGINDHEILNLAALTLNKNWHVRFIEFMPIGNNTLFSDRGWVSSAQLRDQIRQSWGLTESQVRGNGPADVFQIPGAKGTLGFISQMSECFCDRCNRIRLSADGWLRPCLLNESGQIDLKTALRSGQTIEQLQQKVRELLNLKSEINFKERDPGTIGTYSRTMSQIGG